jgi:hypothetical protein
MSLAMAGGASAAVAPTADVPQRPTLTPVTTLSESEVTDVSLATFYVFDKELGGSSLGERLQLAGGCRGGGGGGCRAGGGCRGGGCGGGACRGGGCGGRGCGCRCAGGCGCACGPCAGCTCTCCLSWGACQLC